MSKKKHSPGKCYVCGNPANPPYVTICTGCRIQKQDSDDGVPKDHKEALGRIINKIKEERI